MSKNYFKRTIFKLSIPSLFFISFTIHAQRINLNVDEQFQYQKNIERTLLNEDLDKLAENTSNNTQRGSINPAPILMADIDDDGMTDSWETSAGLNPNNPKDAWSDLDNDKVLNLFEFQLNSNPNNAASPTVVTINKGGDIALAITSALSGQLIKVEGGRYNVNYTTFTAKNIMIQGGWNANFTSRNFQLNPTVFDGQNIKEVLYFSSNSGTHNIVVDGIRMVRGKQTQGGFCFIMQGNSIGKLSMIDCRIDSCSSTFSFGGAAHIFNWDTSNSEIFLVKTAIVADSSCGIYNQSTDNAIAKWKLINLTISGNQSIDASEGYGISSIGNNTGILSVNIKNSIIWGNQKDAIKVSAFSQTPIAITSSYSNIDNVTINNPNTYTAGTAMLNSNPLFVNTSASNFYLTGSSPCINAGIDVGFAYYSAAPEMGAYEFGSVGINEYVNNSSFSISPNPMNDYSIIRIKDNFIGGQIRIIDLLGREVKMVNVDAQEIIIEKTDLSAGTYFVQLLSNKELRATQKIVIQ